MTDMTEIEKAMINKVLDDFQEQIIANVYYNIDEKDEKFEEGKKLAQSLRERLLDLIRKEVKHDNR